MKKMSPQAWTAPLYLAAQEHLLKAKTQYQSLPEADLLAPPAAGGWSVAQCLNHLNSYGRYYIPAVQHALSTIRVAEEASDKKYRSGWLGNYFINLMKPQNTQKFKALKNHIPPQELDVQAVIAEFSSQQEQWMVLLEKIQQVQQLNVRVPISISPFIRLKLGDVLGFVKAHDQRHIQQADRVLARQKSAVREES